MSSTGRFGAPPRRASERGTVTPLIIGFAAVLLLLCGVVVDASAAYLQRQSLDSLADGAALAGANEVRGAAVFEHGVGDGVVPLATDLAVAAVHEYLRATGAMERYPGLRVRVSVHGDAVNVALRAPLDLPVTVGGLTSGQVGATGAAEVRVAG
ncbi:pilus assembly protein TadG-related protein [Nocardioides daejeonensis]|uniref:pilus assembly protein TadG-related protein n=1 Tax=Nocardioides daejeonensis TaxID=1046556 RepID=UPI000D7477F6|nr:pilus assembly protein TadG-related protein [Nocardioides daejeonensis]